MCMFIAVGFGVKNKPNEEISLIAPLDLYIEPLENESLKVVLNSHKYRTFWLTKGGCSCKLLSASYKESVVAFLNAAIENDCLVTVLMLDIPGDISSYCVKPEKVNKEKISFIDFKTLYPNILINTRYIISKI
ncbi:hypothetical protein [Desulfosporosinus meridiei]|uniref:Uncharacterized protein n=1 Tax=Desulfosporosinus meridiei (strain ATCC BAA-275 / DSM 13257 / KCTC 12902 / NCIMB 13706 / S10) TaxID=768704 RepID=J7IZ62_DESMD|nr:hypothetical protein [Desulfosporosinus meridiei]AFQ43996.1 hypothetical protein Desmer_2055 [Desulfosporosinus meridiei DSM 13257]